MEQNRDEITALQVFYNRPRHAPLRYEDIKQLAEAIAAAKRCPHLVSCEL